MRRHVAAVLVTALVAAAAGCGTGATPKRPAEPPPLFGLGTVRPTMQVARSVEAPTASVTPACGNSTVGPALGPTPNLPPHPLVTVAKPAGGIIALLVNTRGVFIETSTQLLVERLDGSSIHSISLPADLRSTGNNSSSIATDGSGDFYLINYQDGAFAKLSATGRVLWSRPAGHPTGIFSLGQGTSFRVAVSEAGRTDSQLFDADGTSRGTVPTAITSSGYVNQAPDGDLLAAAGGQVKVLSPDGTRVIHEFGGLRTEGMGTHIGGPYQFYYPGQAAEGPDGTIYTADPTSEIEASTSAGLLRAATNLGGTLQLAGGYLYLVDGRVYVESGAIYTADVQVSSMSLAALDTYLSAPQASLDTLGWGAGLATPAAGNYFPPGSRPTVDADFAPWWNEAAGRLELRYRVWDAQQLAVTAPPFLAISLPTTGAALAQVALPISAGDTAPGAYEVEASLYEKTAGGTPLVGTTCLPYTVGAVGDRLDVGALPAGSGSGGPADPRGVALDGQLGLNGLRGALIDWSLFLPACNATDPSEAACGAAAMTFAKAPISYFQAASLALRDHVTYWIQVTGGDSISRALIGRGWWQADIRALVNYYTHPPATCRDCAAVTGWEPWNEPNNTGWATGALYVAKVLEPFYKGVKAADPAATVIGGSTLEVPLEWWQSLISAGGLSFLDVAAVHPYTGNNDTFEEDGILGEVQQLQRQLGPVPVWFTEIGWWSDGDYNVVTQADDLARAVLWQRILHVPVWSYYYSEGSSATGSVSFTLVATANTGDDYVKAGALATMVVANQTADRPFEAAIATGVPHTYAARFGAAPGGSTGLLAVWSDGFATTTEVRIGGADGAPVPIKVVNEYGVTTSTSLPAGSSDALPISGAVTYLVYPTSDPVTIGATVSYGVDLARSSLGATAVASSGDASGAITGSDTGGGWSSSPGDKVPSLTVTLRHPATVDRIIIDTQSPGSTATGLRNYSILVRPPGGDWRAVSQIVGQYADHIEQVAIAPQNIAAVKIVVTEVNYGGYAGGGIPSFWPLDQTAVAFVHSIEIYGGTASQEAVAGGALRSIS